MLLYNTWNTFYPSYILSHHWTVYLPILTLFKSNKEVSLTFNKAKNMEHLGFYAKKIICSDFGKYVYEYEPILNKKGEI